VAIVPALVAGMNGTLSIAMEVAKAAVPTLPPGCSNVAYRARLAPELRRGLRSTLSVRRPVNSGGFDVAAAEGGGSAGGEQDPEGNEHGG
jgi:hypothetical protein